MTKGSRGRRTHAKERVKTDHPDSTQEDASIVQSRSNELEKRSTFFGLVDSNELDYFKQAEATLNIDTFENEEEKNAFIKSVLEEAKGKELKLVTNQICSKLMERLALFGDKQQVKLLLLLFKNHFVELSLHKYSSHVLETLLVRSASIMEQELNENEENHGNDDAFPEQTMEHIFLNIIEEFKPHIRDMVDHQYASHVLRLLILIVSGKELPSSTVSNSTLRSKRSKIARKMIELKDNEDFSKSFQTPPALKNVIRVLCDSVSRERDMKEVRELTIHKVASPVIQLLIQVEGIVDRDRKIWHLIFLPESEGKDSTEESFVEYLLSDPVGAHFLEESIKSGAPRLKYIERLFNLYMKDRILKLARRAKTGAFIIQALLLKLKPLDIQFILDQVVDNLSEFIGDTESQNLELVQAIIDASDRRNNYKKDEIISRLLARLAPGFHKESFEGYSSTDFFENSLRLSSSTLGNTRDDWPTADERRRALFVEKLMSYDHVFIILSWINLLALPLQRSIEMCFHGVFSHVVENSLVVEKRLENKMKSILILRKKLLNLFQNQIVKLACNSYGSHIVDKLWEFTIFLNIYKDRIAFELSSEAEKVKESIYGRLVWKNWNMELFARKRHEWKATIKEQEAAYYEQHLSENENSDAVHAKKPIELKLEMLFKEQNENKLHSNDVILLPNKKRKLRGRNHIS